MKTEPTGTQYFFAKGWPTWIWMTVIPLCIAIPLIRAAWLTVAQRGGRLAMFDLVITIVLSPVLGWFVGILLGWFILGPIYHAQGIENGAPFQPGDMVQVLAGPYRGEVARVYSSWQGDSVRVELGEEAKRKFKDVFSPVELLRETETD